MCVYNVDIVAGKDFIKKETQKPEGGEGDSHV